VNELTVEVDALYRAEGFEWSTPRGVDLAQACDLWAGFPLLFQPGTEWNYSVATDVLGRVVEVASGQRLDEFFATRIFRPLGMTDTAFWAGYMARHHLPGGLDLEAFGRPLYAEVPFRGVGFGLGFGVLIDPVPGKVVGSAGEISWGGAASTAFWVDQEAGLTVSFFTQLLPSNTYPVRAQLRQLVYQALTG
jgi:CubicO group peptidase (beta-lactamase class C family)